jgi:hypothetical protein
VSPAAAPPTRPSAHAACPRTSGSGSPSALDSTGSAPGDPQFPSATQTFRANPALPARRIAEPRLNASQASGSSAISRSATSDGASVPGWREGAGGSAGRFTETFHVNRPPPPPAAPPAPAPHTPAPPPAPRTWSLNGHDFLADIAPVHPVPHGLAKLQRDRPPVLDGQVRDAEPGIHDGRPVGVPPQEGSGGAGVEASPAASAVVRSKGGSASTSASRRSTPRKKYDPMAGVDQHGVPPRTTRARPAGPAPARGPAPVSTTDPPRGATGLPALRLQTPGAPASAPSS